MDGNSLLAKLGILLEENQATSGFWDPRSSYDYLYAAALEYARRTKVLTATQTITTVAGQAAYDLNPDFMMLFVSDTRAQPVVKFNDGNADYWLSFRPYEAITFADTFGMTGATAPIPYNFGLVDNPVLYPRVTGTATSAGAQALGEATLTDAAAPFANVAVADEVHNTTDGSSGVVIGLTSTSQLVTAMFGGTTNGWAQNDSYVVVPQGRKQIVLDPPPANPSNTVTVNYYARPAPVYSPYRTYRFEASAELALVQYAAYLYKYRDRDPNQGDALYKHFDLACRRLAASENKGLQRNRIRVTMTRSSLRDRSYR